MNAILGLLTLLFYWKWLGNLPIFINTCEAIDLLINPFWFTTTLSVAVTSFPWFWPQVIHSHHSLKLKFVLYFCSKSHQKWFPCSVLFIDFLKRKFRNKRNLNTKRLMTTYEPLWRHSCHARERTHINKHPKEMKNLARWLIFFQLTFRIETVFL